MPISNLELVNAAKAAIQERIDNRDKPIFGGKKMNFFVKELHDFYKTKFYKMADCDTEKYNDVVQSYLVLFILAIDSGKMTPERIKYVSFFKKSLTFIWINEWKKRTGGFVEDNPEPQNEIVIEEINEEEIDNQNEEPDHLEIFTENPDDTDNVEKSDERTSTSKKTKRQFVNISILTDVEIEPPKISGEINQAAKLAKQCIVELFVNGKEEDKIINTEKLLFYELRGFDIFDKGLSFEEIDWKEILEDNASLKRKSRISDDKKSIDTDVSRIKFLLSSAHKQVMACLVPKLVQHNLVDEILKFIRPSRGKDNKDNRYEQVKEIVDSLKKTKK